MFEMEYYDEALNLFNKCLNLDNNNEKASIHFYIAQTLINIQGLQNHSKFGDDIEYSLYKAMTLQSTIVKYRVAFAKFADKSNKFHQANHSYKIAINMTDRKDSSLLTKYNTFLENRGLMNEINCIHQNRIKLIVYDFNVIIYTKRNLCQTDDLFTKEIQCMFGGKDRIECIKQHFKEMNEYNVQNILISSDYSSCIIYKLLNRLKLDKCIRMVFGNDIQQCMMTSVDKSYAIIKIKDYFNLQNSDGVLYVSDNYEDVIDTQNECKIYFVNIENMYPLRGLGIDDFKQIGCMVRNSNFIVNINLKRDSVYNESKSLSALDKVIFNEITNEIYEYIRNGKIMKSIKYIEFKNESDIAYYAFIEYAHNLIKAICACNNNQYWTAAHYFQKVLELEQSQLDVWRRYAKCCSYLKHDETAIYAYMKALRINASHYYTNLSLGYHYLMTKDYVTAEKTFINAWKISKFDLPEQNLKVGLARVYEEMGNDNLAEIYYKSAINHRLHTKIYEPAHYYYGVFLMRKNLLLDAKTQFEICVSNSPNKFENYKKICDIILQSDTDPGCIMSTYINKLVGIDAQSPISRYYYQMYYKASYVCYPEHLNAVITHDWDFDKFWFDFVDMIDPDFNGYYDKFVEHGLNNINWLLYEFAFEKRLIEFIKIQNKNHLCILVSKVLQYRELMKYMRC